ncbi:MAG: uracil-DNA glycosylase, partial [Candidatus Firestonebacteria bacterium]
NNIADLAGAVKAGMERAAAEGYVVFKDGERGLNGPLFIQKQSIPGGEQLPKNNAVLLKGFYEQIRECVKCRLGETRQNFVFGEGDPEAKLVFIGEAPGADEDEQGRPFVGRAGQLLTKIIESIDFKREEVFIMNVLKCRPPENRPPEPEEVQQCWPYLERQLEIIKPKIICTLGNPATHNLLKNETGISKLRGTKQDYKGILVIPTYHPSACLRNPNLKVDVWKDVKFIRKEYDRLCGSRD